MLALPFRPSRQRKEPNAGFLFRLERAGGEPAEPSQLSSAVPNWSPGHTIDFGHKTLALLQCAATMPTNPDTHC